MAGWIQARWGTMPLARWDRGILRGGWAGSEAAYTTQVVELTATKHAAAESNSK